MTLWLSLVEVPPGTSAFGGADKVEHAFAYFVTSLLLLLAAVWRPGRGDGVLAPWTWWVLGAMVLAGGAVEIVQSFVGREAELADWVAEIVAVVAGGGRAGGAARDGWRRSPLGGSRQPADEFASVSCS